MNLLKNVDNMKVMMGLYYKICQSLHVCDRIHAQKGALCFELKSHLRLNL